MEWKINDLVRLYFRLQQMDIDSVKVKPKLFAVNVIQPKDDLEEVVNMFPVFQIVVLVFLHVFHFVYEFKFLIFGIIIFTISHRSTKRLFILDLISSSLKPLTETRLILTHLDLYYIYYSIIIL